MPVSRIRLSLSCLAFFGVLLVPLVTAVPAAADQIDACDGFARKDVLRRLGGRNAFDRKGAETWQDLARRLEGHHGEVEAILEAKGLGHLTQRFFDALSTGAVTERELQAGDQVQWMAYRKGGKPVARGPFCLAPKKAYGAFEIQIKEESGGDVAQPSCAFTATGDCRAHTLSVKVPAGSQSVAVTFNGKEIISGGKTSWEGPFEDRFSATPTFTSSATAQGTKTVTTHTFIIPKICLNLAYVGATTKEIPGETKSCTETVKVKSCPEPHCDITPPTGVRKNKPFSATITGVGDVRIEKVVNDKKGTEFPYSDGMKLKKKGYYTLHGTSTTEFGDEATCTARFCVGRKCKDTGVAAAGAGGAAAGAGSTAGGRGSTTGSGGGSTTGSGGGSTARGGEGSWILRAFGAGISAGDEFRTSGSRPGGISERTKLQVGNGTGFGVSAERKINSRWGIELGLLAGELDSTFTLDLNDQWGMSDDDVGFLALTAGPNFHLTPESPVDFYLGPFIGFAQTDDGEYRALGENFKTDFGDEFIWGAQLGLDIPFGESAWGANLGLRYIDLALGDGDQELNLDPTIFSAGLSYRF